MSKFVKAGTVINGPDGQGYRVVRDLDPDVGLLTPQDVEPFGGAPAPVIAEPITSWLLTGLQQLVRD